MENEGTAAESRNVRAFHQGCAGNEPPRPRPLVRLQVLQQGSRRVKSLKETPYLRARIPSREEIRSPSREGSDHRSIYAGGLVLQRILHPETTRFVS